MATEPRLSVRRKADRQKMADRLVALAEKHGFAARQAVNGYMPRTLYVDVEMPRGLRLSVTLDGDSSQADTFVLPWHFDTGADATLSPDFAVRANASVNQHHRQKATAVRVGFPSLLSNLESAFVCVVDGSAFETKEHA